MALGENGILNNSKEIVEQYKNEQIKEQEVLKKAEKEFLKIAGELPENTKDNPQESGTEVKMPENWYLTTENDTVKKSNVSAIAVGNGETVPVPEGFYYVGGNINTGVVISDNKADQNKYANVKNGDVPSGAVYKSDGSAKKIVYDNMGNIILDEYTEEEKKTAILGNQFVWIPVTKEEYTKKDWTMTSATTEMQTNTEETLQVQKYSGFYIGRYEAGIGSISLSTGIDFGNQNIAYSWVNDSFSIRDGLNQTATGKISTKAGEIPYYHADYETALKLSNNMYETEYVKSGLTTETQWDVMLKFISDDDNTVITASSWGNYIDGDITYTAGEGRYATVNGGNGSMTSAFTKSDGEYHYGMTTTGISEDVKRKNIYEVAGNLWEWLYGTYSNQSAMLCGGSFLYSYLAKPVYIRGYDTFARNSTDYGFRPVLYIKV